MAGCAPASKGLHLSVRSRFHQPDSMVSGITDVESSLAVIVADECRLLELRIQPRAVLESRILIGTRIDLGRTLQIVRSQNRMPRASLAR